MPDDTIMTDARAPGRGIGQPAHTLCAPEIRAQETAHLLGLQPAREDALLDCDFGAWKGKTLEDIQRSDPGGAVLWLDNPQARPHGGECLGELCARVGVWLDAFAENGHVLAVTHAAVMRAAALHVLEAPFAAFWRLDIQPLSAMDLWFNGQSWTVRSLNDRLAD
jgi:broad specificity phosphatase PhoE